mmetsp:Transcript_25986/g.79021  ORF Transcript_25986/g.79021 Transcript_25986/m.79021 type:complete len:206 (+) Transcript_25986:416-1033(+)
MGLAPLRGAPRRTASVANSDGLRVPSPSESYCRRMAVACWRLRSRPRSMRARRSSERESFPDLFASYRSKARRTEGWIFELAPALSRLCRPSSATSASLTSGSVTISTKAATMRDLPAIASNVSASPETVALAIVHTASLLKSRIPSPMRFAMGAKASALSMAATCSGLPAATFESANKASLRASASGQSINLTRACRPPQSITA